MTSSAEIGGLVNQYILTETQPALRLIITPQHLNAWWMNQHSLVLLATPPRVALVLEQVQYQNTKGIFGTGLMGRKEEQKQFQFGSKGCAVKKKT